MELKIARHPSGRHTLMERRSYDTAWCDVMRANLFGEFCADHFQRALDTYVRLLKHRGLSVRWPQV